MKKKINETKNLIDSIEWNMIIPGRHRTGLLAPNEVAIGFVKSKPKQFDKIDRIVVRIGCDVAIQLGWALNDRISIFYDKNHTKHFLICKTSSGNKIGAEIRTNILRIQALIPPSIKLDYRATSAIDYTIHNKNQLFLKID